MGWIALILLLLTGLYNMHYRGVAFSQLMEGAYNQLFFMKLSLFAMVIATSAYHDFYIGPRSIKLMAEQNGNNEITKRYVRTARIVGELNLLLALVAVALGIIIVRGW
jgi:putative copper export protein